MKRRYILLILALCLVFSTTIFVLVQNRDRHSIILERLDPNTYVTTDLPKLMYLSSLTKKTNTDFLTFLEQSGTYECLNGKNPSSMDAKEQLLEFIKGPCLPVVAVPGLLASRLKVKIDCETFKASNPEIFEKCGWSTCSSWEFWHSKPDEEYTLWISDFLGPLSIIFHDSVQCWGNIIQLNYDPNEPDMKKKYTSPIGTEVKIYGEHGTENSQCGFEAVNDILPVPYQTLYSKGFESIQNALTNMGYQTGLSLYSTPYDWRKTALANGVSETINQTVRQIYELTGKPAIIMAHSLGNFGTLHFLNSLSAEEKQKYVANYVSVTNPLVGSPKALKTFVGGDQDYVYKKYGINFYAQKMLIKGSSGAFDLLPKNAYDYFSDKPWLQDWRVRSDYENNNDVRTEEGRAFWEKLVEDGDYPFKWFPHPLNNCSYGFEERRDECGLYMYNFSSTPLAVVLNDSWTASQTQLKGFFDDYVLTTNLSDYLFDDINTNNIYELINPEVPVTLIYGSHLKTDMTYEWQYDPRNNSRNNEFAFANSTTFSQGDQTVPTSSALLPALKWAWEFDNKEKEGLQTAKPVKTVEICSTYNNKESIYDLRDPSSPYQVETNEYIGLDCDCFTNPNDHPVLGQNCDHADILNDSKFVKFIQQIVNANYNITDTSDLLINQLSADDLKMISKNCPHVDVTTDVFAQFANRKSNDVEIINA